MDLAIYDLKLHKGRFIATIIGVGLLFTIVLAMNGIYRGLIFERTAVIKVTNRTFGWWSASGAALLILDFCRLLPGRSGAAGSPDSISR